jgi:isopentenyl diphosphate isomerase/L-lactate dehydrogenase-like FMN-dependent dehydrogenase
VRDAVGDAASIVIDGGFARGTDVIKGIAWGADAVAIGRIALWGLAADGANGVACTMDILRRELRTSMALAGQTSIRGLTPDAVFRVD